MGKSREKPEKISSNLLTFGIIPNIIITDLQNNNTLFLNNAITKRAFKTFHFKSTKLLTFPQHDYVSTILLICQCFKAGKGAISTY